MEEKRHPASRAASPAPSAASSSSRPSSQDGSLSATASSEPPAANTTAHTATTAPSSSSAPLSPLRATLALAADDDASVAPPAGAPTLVAPAPQRPRLDQDDDDDNDADNGRGAAPLLTDAKAPRSSQVAVDASSGPVAQSAEAIPSRAAAASPSPSPAPPRPPPPAFTFLETPPSAPASGVSSPVFESAVERNTADSVAARPPPEEQLEALSLSGGRSDSDDADGGGVSLAQAATAQGTGAKSAAEATRPLDTPLSTSPSSSSPAQPSPPPAPSQPPHPSHATNQQQPTPRRPGVLRHRSNGSSAELSSGAPSASASASAAPLSHAAAHSDEEKRLRRAGYQSKVGFDTMPDAEDTNSGTFSFTLQLKSRGYKRSRHSRTFMCCVDDRPHSERALEWLMNSLVEDGDEVVALRVLEGEAEFIDQDAAREDARELLHSIVQLNEEVQQRQSEDGGARPSGGRASTSSHPEGGGGGGGTGGEGASRHHLNSLLHHHHHHLFHARPDGINDEGRGATSDEAPPAPPPPPRRINVVVEFVAGKPVPTALRLIHMYRPCSLSVGTRGRHVSRLQQMLGAGFVGSTSRELLARSPVPVVVVRPEAKVLKHLRERDAGRKRPRSYHELMGKLPASQLPMSRATPRANPTATAAAAAVDDAAAASSSSLSTPPSSLASKSSTPEPTTEVGPTRGRPGGHAGGGGGAGAGGATTAGYGSLLLRGGGAAAASGLSLGAAVRRSMERSRERSRER